MKACVFQHVPFEGLGCIEQWLIAHQYSIGTTRLFNNETIPDIDLVDFLIIMGGPMSVNDEQRFPWLNREKQFTKMMIERKNPVLGVCLGAQMIASALGAKVYPNAEKEIGWFPIQSGALIANGDIFHFTGEPCVFHWHGETFDLPDGATRLAQSAACTNQAFQFGSHVIGLQFHLEMMTDNIKELIHNCRNELVLAAYIQTEQKILSTPLEYTLAANSLMNLLLTFLTKQSY